MESSNISLVIFSLLTQFPAGLVILAFASDISGNNTLKEIKSEQRVVITSLLLLAGGLAASFLHLGYPLNALHALRNIGSSWMSREIAAVSLLMALLFLSGVGMVVRIKWLNGGAIKTITTLTAIILVFIMIRLYSLPSMKFLHHPSTAIDFITVTLWGGAALFAIPEIRKQNHLITPFAIISSVLITAVMVNILIFSRFAEPSLPPVMWVIIPSLFSITISILLAGGKLKNNRELWSVIVTVTGITAITAGRFLFLNYTISVL